LGKEEAQSVFRRRRTTISPVGSVRPLKERDQDDVAATKKGGGQGFTKGTWNLVILLHTFQFYETNTSPKKDSRELSRKRKKEPASEIVIHRKKRTKGWLKNSASKRKSLSELHSGQQGADETIKGNFFLLHNPLKKKLVQL